jgi:predicted XRE-type DNA-binding protein
MKNQNDIKIVLCDRITSRLENLGLTQVAAAEHLGIAPPRLSEIKRHKLSEFSIDGLVEILGHFGVEVRFEVVNVSVDKKFSL